MEKLSHSQVLVGLAGLAAALAALAGFIPGIYRDSPALVAQSHGQDVATLVLGVPVLLIGLRAAAHGSLRGQLVVEGTLGYLLYTYLVFAFDAVLNPVTVLYIAVAGCASWSILISVRNAAEKDVQEVIGAGPPRRVTGVFLLCVASLFGLLWLSQIATAAVSGIRPQALIDAGWPNNPIYVLDLAFVLPLSAVTGLRLVRGRPANRVAIPLLVFTSLLATGVLSITAFAWSSGQPLEAFQAAIFIVVTIVSLALAWLGLRPRTLAEALRRHPIAV